MLFSILIHFGPISILFSFRVFEDSKAAFGDRFISEMAGIVVVFDFDKTIIDLDSDRWVVDKLGATEIFNQLLRTLPWNSLMDRIMKELHAQGKTIQDIEEVLKLTPIHPRIVSAIKSAHALGCDLRIVSDANVFFIETILKHLGLRDCFSEINSNPSYVDEEGKLRILPYHDFHSSSHGCNICLPHMCKGLIIERIRVSVSKEGKKKFIYLGDGRGDFCPSLKLKEGDYVMPRKNFRLWNLLCESRMLIKADIHEWTNGEELELLLIQLINTNSAHLFTIDYKFQPIPMSSQEEALPQVLPVPH